ncbi:MAG: aldo/keto reductase [Propionibacteriaceae bacterium]|nr:aldo/keto reductase [Propionibacteriaceae bacterium]
MNRRFVGASSLEVSDLGLGTLTWGRDVQPPEARALMRAFVSADGNLVDTAPTYGDGLAERLIGSLMRHDVSRDKLVLATKAGFGSVDGDHVLDTSAKALLADLDGSLSRLGTDYVDLWQVHAWGDAPLDETMAALDKAVASGKARYAGVANYVGWQIGTAATWQACTQNAAPIVAAQNEYSLLARRVEVEVLPAIRYHGMGFFPWSPLGRGVLTGQYRGSMPPGSRGASRHLAWFVEPYLQPRADAVVEAVARAAGGLGLSAAQVALLWVRDAPGVTAPLVGARTLAQLEPLLAVTGETLPTPIVEALDDITGGPKVVE